MLVNPFMVNLVSGHWNRINLDVKSLVAGDFGAGAVMISYGAILGKANLA